MATFAVQSAADPITEGQLPPISSRQDLFESLAPLNIAPERDEVTETTLYGPGIRIELDDRDPITQFRLVEVDTDISFRVVVKLAQGFDWILTDEQTGHSRHIYRPESTEQA